MRMIVDSFLYPFRGSGPVMMVLGTGVILLFWVAAWAPLFGGLASLVLTAYLAAFYLDVIASTVVGGEEVPDWPSITGGWDEIMLQALRFFAAVLISGLPAFGAMFLESGDAQTDQVMLWLAMAIGALYLPMALLNAAIYQTFASLLPHRVLPNIWRCMPSYLWSALLFFLVGLLGNWSGEVSAKLSYGGWVLSSFLAYYFLVVPARLVGMIYRKSEEKLDV